MNKPLSLVSAAALRRKPILPLLLATALIAGCGSGISGDYGGPECPYQKMTFKGDGAVYLTFMGTELRGEYSVDGDKISVTGGQSAGLVFTRDGDTLKSGVMGMRFKCEEL